MNMWQVILNLSIQDKITAWTRPTILFMFLNATFHCKQTLSVTLTLEVGTWVLQATCHLGMSNTCVKLFKNMSIDF